MRQPKGDLGADAQPFDDFRPVEQFGPEHVAATVRRPLVETPRHGSQHVVERNFRKLQHLDEAGEGMQVPQRERIVAMPGHLRQRAVVDGDGCHRRRNARGFDDQLLQRHTLGCRRRVHAGSFQSRRDDLQRAVRGVEIELARIRLEHVSRRVSVRSTRGSRVLVRNCGRSAP
jgi:hypothetical protein